MTEEPKKKPGRKPLPPSVGKTARIDMRGRPDDVAAWKAAAKAAGMGLTAWLELLANRATGRT